MIQWRIEEKNVFFHKISLKSLQILHNSYLLNEWYIKLEIVKLSDIFTFLYYGFPELKNIPNRNKWLQLIWIYSLK